MSNSEVVVVTGVSSGIGLAVAQSFVAKGYRVFGTVRSIAQQNSIRGVELIEMNVCDDHSVEKAISDIVKRSFQINILVNNAGVSLLGCIEESSVQEAQLVFDTNLFGVLRTVRAVLPHMKARKSGRIVNVSSVLGFLPAPYQGIYGSSKHALEGFSETLDHEVRHFGVRVSLVEPSFTKTRFDANSARVQTPLASYDTIRSDIEKAIAQNNLKAPGPEHVAKIVVEAAVGPWAMRHTASGEASKLRFIRRFLPSSLLDRGLRKTFGLS
ncbi:oxidoreductase [Pseudomonas syringae pv. tagetis]|uniref:Oxidoreductase n=1 Tax=Pseudomonas syringae pv. tagetis TaxID=129140 RepID=A0ABW7NVA3_9PSED|nr:oxidoreductase [Pseudomonas syringae group genomosp. 7]UNB68594.1 oxidoreductase [Pseudomonas syringae pv. tagetis]